MPRETSESVQSVAVELAHNLRVFQTAADIFSHYSLFAEEKYLFNKYYKPGDSVLDHACGVARTTLLLHERGLAVRGVDRSDVLIGLASKRFPYLDLRVGGYERIDEPDCSFLHVLISFNGLDYAFPAAQREAAISECFRVLKPGGTFIFSSHNLKSLHWFSPYYRRRLRWKLRNCGKAFRNWEYVFEDIDQLHTFYASPEYIVRQTENVGFKFLEMRYPRRLPNDSLDRYFTPYIHYAFRKRGDL
jgi:ubiquinone/menaquinone biosynthesis C-methylase UbiE